MNKGGSWEILVLQVSPKTTKVPILKLKWDRDSGFE